MCGIKPPRALSQSFETNFVLLVNENLTCSFSFTAYLSFVPNIHRRLNSVFFYTCNTSSFIGATFSLFCTDRGTALFCGNGKYSGDGGRDDDVLKPILIDSLLRFAVRLLFFSN